MMSRYLAGVSAAALIAQAHAQSNTKISFNAGEEPETKTWAQPAAFNYTDNAESEDSWAIDLAGKIEMPLVDGSSHTKFGRVVVQRNTLLAKESENYVLELGAKFDLNTADVTGSSPDTDAWYFPTKLSVAYADKTTFPDSKADCSVVPLPNACLRQEERSVRTSVSMQPFRSNWETTFFVNPGTGQPDGDAWVYSAIPSFGILYDDVVDAKVNAAGVEPDGSVFAGRVSASLAASPRWTAYRLVIGVTYQGVFAFSRSPKREPTFQKDSSVVTVSANYELGARSFGTGPRWIPSIGVTYTKGDDPVAGKMDQDFVSLGFRLAYKPE